MDKELSDKYHDMQIQSLQLWKQKNELLVRINDLLIYKIQEFESINIASEKRIKAIEKLSEA